MNKNKPAEKKHSGILGSISELVEMLGLVTVAVMLLFAFGMRYGEKGGLYGNRL